ncbi:MAG: CDP-alcohol phosphatidyltransferase family protein, partial [Gammaproteobacteria bacterium]|nr:CDP-alcohol phosphatidyltransferase family protein [Gammaproteobacteria bacterium]
ASADNHLGEWLYAVGKKHTRVLVIDRAYLIDPILVRAVLVSPASTILVDTDAPEPSRDGAQRLTEFGDRTDNTANPGPQSYFCGIVSLEAGAISAKELAGVSSMRALVQSLLHRKDTVKLDVAGLPTFQSDIRRKRRPVWMRCYNRDRIRIAKRILVDGAQKGSLDWPAQWIHAPLENSVVSRICETRVTPNQVTLVTNIAAWAVTLLFFYGHIMAGLVGAAVVGVLDGLDGKLARVKLMTSKVGEFEHIFDLVFEYSWWFALGWALSGGDVTSSVFTATIILILCNLGDSLATVSFLYWRGRHVGRTLDNYTHTDYLIRKVAGRRNVYIWIMLAGVVITDPVTAFYVATVWAVITVVVRGARAVTHMASPLVERPADNFLG